ncbi:hypothetical protein BIV57_02965 [Mangrovactinospora gilvigrisea]|uniref:Alkaline shock response membrane anchor protein AmaP n=1 Tax=Mangrovactinospora gilvigrisea TaxID=1428644 RepID=A0A1J7CBP7_9ACTN|nr:hypothetical protein BIV57_02965 [Mangrovactinospora gilvigrisea]
MGLIGLAAIAGGGWVLYRGFRGDAGARHGSVLSAADRAHWSHRHGFWTDAEIALGALALLGLVWLVWQWRDRRPHVQGFDAAARAVLAGQAGRLPGTASATVRTAGSRRRPRAVLELELTEDADPAEVLAALWRGPLAEARAQAHRPEMPTVVRFTGAHPIRGTRIKAQSAYR